MPSKANLVISVATKTDPGCVRDANEDSIRWTTTAPDEPSGAGSLIVIADGMGGALGGETASSIAVDEITRKFYAGGRPLAQIVQEAGQVIFEHAEGRPDLAGMGTTCVALAIQDGYAMAAYVGDSRLYLVRDRQIYQMTEDHSLVAEMVRAGMLTRDEARNHEDRNVISRALGTKSEVEVAAWDETFPLRPADRLVVSTDGLHDLVQDEEILAIVISSDSATACENLVNLAKERGGFDNITVGIVNVDAAKKFDDRKAVETRQFKVPA